MLEGLRTAAAGMLAQQQKLDAVSNDLANANTTGYKRLRVGFSDLLYEQGGRPTTSDNAQLGTGSRIVHNGRQFQQGSSRFTIRLDPPELGRVDVKMHVDATGTVNARLTVERAETLDMFQRDRSSLERALSQAGVDSGKTNLEFSLRQNPFAGMTGGNQQQASTANSGARFSLSAADDDTATIPAITLYRGIASAGGVNLFV